MLPKVPAGHGEHWLRAVDPANEPSPHGVQATELKPVETNPTGHGHANVSPDALQKLPGAQGAHAVKPELGPKVPSGHGTGEDRLDTAQKKPDGQRVNEADIAGQNAPGGQTTALATVDPAGQNDPTTQGPLHVANVSPVVAPKEAAWHGRQALMDVCDEMLLKVPAKHGSGRLDALPQ